MIVAYIANNQGQAITQLFDIIQFDCVRRIDGIDEAVFLVNSNDQNIVPGTFREMNRVRIAREKNNHSRLFIEGYIKAVIITNLGIEVVVKGAEYLLTRQLVHAAKSYTSQSVISMMTAMLGEINARYDTGLSIHPDTTTDLHDMQINKNTDFYSVIRTIAQAGGYHFKIFDNKLLIASQLGDDRTTGVDYFAFKWDHVDEEDRNILDRAINMDADTIANAITEKTSGYVYDTASITTYGRLERNINPSVNIATAMNKELADSKSSTKQIDLTPKVDGFFFSEVGDVVNVSISGNNAIAQYTGVATVMEKRMKTLDINNVDVKLSTTTKKTLNQREKINEYEDRINQLELS